MMRLGFWSWGLGFRVWGLGFGSRVFRVLVWDLGLTAWGFGFGVYGLELALRVQDPNNRVLDPHTIIFMVFGPFKPYYLGPWTLNPKP